MSGDVQPRKRKDKRRKRDDDESSHGVHITKMGNDDLHLHVHHDHGTGGNWCAKIIFFSLMAVLLGLVGLIILENRGLEDMDTPLSESRFSNYFTGLVDEHRGEHDAHDVHKPSGEALDEHDDHDDHDDLEEEEEEPLSEELDDETEQEEDTEQEAETEQEEYEEEEEEAAEEEQEEDDEEEEDNNAGENITAEDPEEDEPYAEATAEATVEATAEYDVQDSEEEEPENDVEDDVAESQEPAPSTAELDEDDDDDNNNDEADEVEIEESVQSKAQSSPTTPKSDKDDADDEEKYDADDDDFESLDEEPEELVRQVRKADVADSEEQEQEDNKEEPTEEGSSWLASLAVKFGVGVALALVSRLVLIRKSPNTTEDEPPPPEAIMRRRLTIATEEDQIPDDLEEIPLLDDEYSEEEIEIEEEIEVEISDIEEENASGDGDVALSASYLPETFEQLSSMYKSSPVPPSSETKPQEPEKPEETEEPLKPSGFSDLYVEYEDGTIEDYEHDGETDEEDEISDEEEDEISDVDDADLMSRLEAKYGRLPVKEYESDPDSDDPTWTQIKPKDPNPEAPASAPAAEDSFQRELRQANAEMIRENYAQALRSFNTLIQHYADEPLAHLGRAHLLERLAERERSNQRLWEAIDSYKRYLAFGELVASDREFLSAAERCIEHLRFMGYHQQTVAIHELLIERLPAAPRLRNQLSLTHLTANNMRLVKLVAAETLKLWPADPVAQLHYGLALKQLHGDYDQALPYLQNAIESKAEGTQEAYFYLALGETLQRMSRQPEAVEVHRQAVAMGLIASVYQRSLYNEPKLRAQPFWQPSETGYGVQLRKLQKNWMSIRMEALALLSHRGYFADEAENLRHKGIWQQFELFAKGQLVRKNCQRAPITCGLMKEFPESSGCRRGQVKFSVMQAETHVWPHCGPTNCRLRAHLTLVAPEPERTSLRVAEQESTWREGELIIFDDSFEHEVWHNGTRPRLVLILDMWHPDLNAAQRRSLTPI
ncbi:aspartyl/asparaginyl beta-hydroxylase isoform X9 [Drosophila obscura]|uniref:aspartyl/asparaginyl beta-hydroxylase isoform X9 n=1 Tax=Drosophila obscura TaxID=7282 RepID=UPI001BB17498|nr:aspartyl/asparaginyl beta-hydroxylase isoform X9 [Drosophila obscura]